MVAMAVTTGLEPATSSVTDWRALQLLHATIFCSDWSLICVYLELWRLRVYSLIRSQLPGADRGTRTLTKSPPADFESAASAIPPHPQVFINICYYTNYNSKCQSFLEIFFTSPQVTAFQVNIFCICLFQNLFLIRKFQQMICFMKLIITWV